MSHRVVITHWIHAAIVEFLSRSFEVAPNMTEVSLPRHVLLRRAQDARAIMIFPPDVVDEDFLDWCPDLMIVASTSDDLGQVDVQACTYRGVWVTKASGLATVPSDDRGVNPSQLRSATEEVQRAVALEAAANIFEALIDERPKGAINSPVLRQKPKRPVQRVRRLLYDPRNRPV
jgi:hypothetical protein